MNHSHVLYDSDPHFKIDPISRKITNESSSKTTIIQHDHNSERFTFECPRYVEGHDLSLCNIVEIHYLNVESNTKIVRAGVYSVDDLQIKPDDENSVVCSWLVPNNATQFVGQLQFLVRFSCAREDTGKIEYVWNTAIYSGISVSTGIYNAESPSDNPVPPFNFVTTIDGQLLKFFVGTQAEYNRLPNTDKECLFAIITDDKTKDELFDRLGYLEEDFERVKNEALNGSVTAGRAESAAKADRADYADVARDADHAIYADLATYAETLHREGSNNQNISSNGLLNLPSSGLYLFIAALKQGTSTYTTFATVLVYVKLDDMTHGSCDVIWGEKTAKVILQVKGQTKQVVIRAFVDDGTAITATIFDYIQLTTETQPRV